MKGKRLAYRKRCKNCGQEIIVTNVKTELCWRCREEIRKGIRRNSTYTNYRMWKHVK